MAAKTPARVSSLYRQPHQQSACGFDRRVTNDAARTTAHVAGAILISTA
jgi:hypothetical protein